jgi:hypothetical protein
MITRLPSVIQGLVDREIFSHGRMYQRRPCFKGQKSERFAYLVTSLIVKFLVKCLELAPVKLRDNDFLKRFILGRSFDSHSFHMFS